MVIANLTTPRYLVVKFIPDLTRMEPRNVGILVWSRKGTAARFMGEKANSPGEIDARLPGFIKDVLPAYRQWVKFWQTEISKTNIEPYSGGEPVSVDSVDFFKVLKSSGKGNFLVEDGGILLDELSPCSSPKDFADYLFQHLVEEPSDNDAMTKDVTLQNIAEDAFEKSHIKADPHFHNDYPIDCPIGDAGKKTKLQFSHAYKNGSLTLLQKVSFPKTATTLKTIVRSNAFMFEQAIKSNFIDRSHGCALIHILPEQRNEPEISEAIDVLDTYATVYNLHDQEELFIQRLKELQNS